MHDRARRIERRRGAVVLCFFTTIISVFGWLSSGAWAFSVTLAWDPNSESDLAGYTIYYDTDSGPPYRYSINVPLSSPDFNRYSPEYTVSGLADGTYYFVATAYKSGGLESGYSNEVSTTSTVNRPPVLNPIGSRTIDEAQTLTFALTATDPDGDSLSYSASNLPTGASFNPTTRTFSWTPGYGATGNYSVQFTVTDNGTPPASDSETVTITVGNVNRPPVLNLEVNGISGSTTVYTNDPNGQVDIRIVASDDALVSQYLILDGNSNANSGTFTGIPGGPRQNPIFTVSDFVLNNSDGSHTIYAWVKDNQGLVSATATKMNVILDRVAPTVSMSHSSPGPYQSGQTVLLTANFTDSNPILGTPTISIDYAGTDDDVSGAVMTQVNNKQWTCSISIPAVTDGTAVWTIAAFDAAGNPLGSHTGNTFVVGTPNPSIVGFPVIDHTESSITVTYSESNMQNATLAGNYSFDNGLLVSGNGVDISGFGKIFKLPLNPATLQINTIYSIQIGKDITNSLGKTVIPSTISVNDNDNDGMADDWEKQWFGSSTAKDGAADTDGDGSSDRAEYQYARGNVLWGSNRWALSPVSKDSDGDGISDTYEVVNGLNPVSSLDRDLDLDNDGWTNYEEYSYGTSPNDPNSLPGPADRIGVVEVIPFNNAGILPDRTRIPNNVAFAARIESVEGIDLTDPYAVTFDISDGTYLYPRKLNEKNAKGAKIVQAVQLDGDGDVAYSLWVVYYRSNETNLPNFYPYESTVKVTVSVKDKSNKAMDPIPFTFRIQGQEQDNAEENEKPATSMTVNTLTLKSTVRVDAGPLKGASITYDSSLLQEIGLEPYFGPLAEVPPLTEAEAAGVPANLLPPAVFPRGVTVTIPCPGDGDVSDLAVYYHDGERWVLACDGSGNITPEGDGWMMPGSRVNHNHGNPSTIELKVYHFSAVVAGGAVTPTATVTVDSGGGGCFISTALE